MNEIKSMRLNIELNICIEVVHLFMQDPIRSDQSLSRV